MRNRFVSNAEFAVADRAASARAIRQALEIERFYDELFWTRSDQWLHTINWRIVFRGGGE